MPSLRVLVDADVLYSRTLRDWILMLSLEDPAPFEVCWTEDILAETVARMRDNRPDIDSGALEIIGDRLREFWAENRISSFPAARESFIGHDEGDLHVHSAAVAGGVGAVVTADRKGLFPPENDLARLDHLPYEIYTPDEILLLAREQAPEAVHRVTLAQVRYFYGRRQDVELSKRLRDAGATGFANRIRLDLQRIDVVRLLADCDTPSGA